VEEIGVEAFPVVEPAVVEYAPVLEIILIR
jgi:hypothetical protein